MEKVADRQFLLKRGNGWSYYRRVPTELVPVMGKKFIKKALGVSDIAAARKLRNIENIRVDALFAGLEDGTIAPALADATRAPATSEIPIAVLTEHVRDAVMRLDRRTAEQHQANPPVDRDELKELREQAEFELGILKDPADPRRDEWVAGVSDRILDALGARLTEPQIMAHVSELVRRGLIEVQNRKLDRYDDHHDRGFHDPLFDPARQPEMMFSELVTLFLAEKEEDYRLNDIRQMRADKVQAITAIILEIMGPATAVHTIDDDQVQRLRSMIARLPRNKNKHYPKLTIVEAIQKAEKDGRSGLAPITQSGYLAIFRDILTLAVRKRVLRSNPAEDIKPIKKDKVALEDRRHPLTIEQLKGFFEGKFYRSCAPGAPEPYNSPDRAWRFWVPLVMLYSSARPNEIAQLHIADVKKTKAGTPYIDLVEHEGEHPTMLKTRTSHRRLPIHPELVRMGFLTFVAQRRKEEAKRGPRLFHELKPNKYGNMASYLLRRFRDDFMPAEIRLNERQSFYSIRHSVRDALRRAQVPPEALQAIGGWAQGQRSVSDMYGDARNPDISVMWVKKITYPGLNLSFLYQAKNAV
jgi:integrase